MDLEQIVLPALVAITSLGAFLIGAATARARAGGPAPRRRPGAGDHRPPHRLRGCQSRTGVARRSSAWRALTGEFLSLYLLNDAVLGLLSLLQAVVFHWWWARA